MLGMIRLGTGLLCIVAIAGCTPAGPATPSHSPSPKQSATSPALPLPQTIWVNVGLGVRLRAAADATSRSLEVLSQGAQASVLGQQKAADGAGWYHVRAADGQEGWVSASYVVTSEIYRIGNTNEGWSLMLPGNYAFRVVPTPSPGFTEAGAQGSVGTPFLRVQTAGKADGLPSAVPAQATSDHSAPIEVWSYTVPEQVYRMPDGTYLTVVRVPTVGRAFQFLFFTPDSESRLVGQVLASVILP